MTAQTFLALDLEFNQPSQKIIQVGIAIGGLHESAILTRSWLVSPDEPISPYITQLTGIDDAQIAAGAAPPSQIAADLAELIDSYPDMATNPVVWGEGDAPRLLGFFEGLRIPFPHFGRRSIDVKTIWSFKRLADDRSPRGGLRGAMGSYKLPFLGEPHRADVDAANTLRFFLALLREETQVVQAVKALRGAVWPA